MATRTRLGSWGAAVLLGAGLVGITGTAYAEPGKQEPPAAAEHADPQGQAKGHDKQEPTTPQPPSTADQNPGGANGQCPGGPYCSTTDGSPSENGNGNGESTGKPCAGCVGKADNKNPKGQLPGPQDDNKGYECDANQGIGKGNPAHSGCKPAPTPTPTPTPTATPTTPTTVSSQPPAGGGPAEVLGVEKTVPKAQQVRPVSQVLPNTGSPAGLALVGLAGLGLVAGGAAVLRKATSAPSAGSRRA